MSEEPTVITYWSDLTDDERKERYCWLYDDMEHYRDAQRKLYKDIEKIAGTFVEPYGEGFKCTECGASNIVRYMLIHRVGCTASLLNSAMVESDALLPDD